MKRLDSPDPNDLTPEQQVVYDKIVDGPRGRIGGALSFWLHRPELADRAQELGLYLRYNTTLPPRLSELAILVTARFWGAEFEWMHAPIALKAGHSKASLDAIKQGRTPTFDHDDEALVYEITRDILKHKQLSDEVYARGMDTFGAEAMVDLVAVLGYYSLICMTLNTFKILPDPREDGWSPAVEIA
ncbi:MAG: carboxymuconolactone decarboxylase family protein [Pseudomonadota bacterium]